MPINYKYKPEQQVLYTFFEGMVNADDCSAYVDALLQDVSDMQDALVLMDMSNIEMLDIDYGQAIDLSVHISRLQTKGINNFIFYAPGKNIFGVARMLQMLFEQDGGNCRVIKNEKEVNDIIKNYRSTNHALKFAEEPGV